MQTELDPIRAQLYENANWKIEVILGSWVSFALKVAPDLFPVSLQSPEAFIYEHRPESLGDDDTERLLQHLHDKLAKV